MLSELDLALEKIVGQLTAPGQPFETEMLERDGYSVAAFKTTPPSLAHYFAHFCNEHAAEDFLVDGDIRLTFGETYQAALRAAAGLVHKQGVKKGDRVGIAARNSANWIIAYMGVIMAGGCATLLNGFWGGEELAYGVDLAECDLVLADAGRAKRFEGESFKAKLVLFEHDCSPAEGLTAFWQEEENPGMTAMAMLGELGPDDLATILYTSGSTGRSKGAFSDHRGVVSGVMSYVSQSAMAKALLESRGEIITEQQCALVAVPLFHVTGEVPLMLQSFAIGRKLVMMPRWDAGEALRLMEAEKVTYFVGVPLMSFEIASHPDLEKYEISACRSFAAGGSARPVEHVNKIKKAFPNGFPLLGYGLTETNAVGCGNFNENYLAKPGSTGTATQPMVELAILDNDGNPKPQGEVDEVCIRTVANFKGYWKNEEATQAAFTKDGFFRTGDLGYLDEAGYLYIVDRKKDIIIRGGENITCIEVEDAIYSNTAVAECSVFGLPDERFGEVPAAVVYLKDGEQLSAEELHGFLSEHIAPFKIPQVELIWHADKPLPRLGTMKIDKRSVRTMYAGDLAKA